MPGLSQNYSSDSINYILDNCVKDEYPYLFSQEIDNP